MNLLKDLYDNAETLKGRRLALVLAAIFIVFTVIGISIGYLNNSVLKKDENTTDQLPPVPVDTTISYTGRITYTNPEFYPGEKISFSLVDSSGKEIILLKSKDDKLSIAEGLNVQVVGTEGKTKAGQPYLLVKEVVINASN